MEQTDAVTQPRELEIDLFPHQLVSIHRMEDLESTKIAKKCDDYIIETQLGVNADPTGYGKTLAMIGLIVRDKMVWDLDTPYISNDLRITASGLVKRKIIYKCDKLPATLVLVSGSILKQWDDEFKYTSLKIQSVTSREDIDNLDPENLDVVLIIPAMFNRLLLSYNRYAWKRFIYDEPGHVRVPSMKQLQTGFTWFVTSTPNEIVPLHRKCRTSFMYDVVGKDWFKFDTKFRDIILKSSLEFVSRSFTMPPTHNYYHECFQPLFNIVKGFITENVRIMIEAGDIEGALTTLGGKKTDDIIELIRKKQQHESNEIESRIKLYVLNENLPLVEEWIIKKKRLLIQMAELETKAQEMMKGDCGICLSPFTDPVLEPGCQNIFCGKCLFMWLETKQTCPLCRGTINTPDLIYIQTTKNKNVSKYKNTRKKTKLEKIIEIIKNKPDGKFLIFSSYDKTFASIARVLQEAKIVFKEIKGQRSVINKNIQNYKTGQIPVIFINSNFFGTGLNLQETTDIILYHAMSENMQTQVIGRANRIGREKSLYVHHLL